VKISWTASAAADLVRLHDFLAPTNMDKRERKPAEFTKQTEASRPERPGAT
jgi:hypothetical protein